MRSTIVAMVCLLSAAGAARVSADQSPGVDLGSKTSGIGTDQAPQPSPQPSIEARPGALPSGSGVADTPGKTGLGFPHDGVRQDPGTIPGAPGVPQNANPPLPNPVR